MTADADAPRPVDDAPTARVDEARAALVAMIANDPAKAADIILTCRDLVLAQDDRIRALEKRMQTIEIDALNEMRRLANNQRI